MTEFPGVNRIAAGFDERTGDAGWESDDEVVFALRLRRGEKVDRWLLRLRVMAGERLTGSIEPPDQSTFLALWEEGSWSYTITDHGQRKEAQVTSKMLPVMATVCDEQGRKLTASAVKLPVRLLGRGVLPAIDCAVAASQAQAQGSLSEPAREVALHPLIETTLGLMSLLNVVQENDRLAEYFWQVVEKPSVWSVITGFGVKTTFSMGFEKSVPAANLPPDLPAADRAFVVPMQIDVNGSPALFLELTVTDAARPFSLCGGIVAGVARHPTKADHALELQLIAARLGTAKPVKMHVKPGPEPGSRAVQGRRRPLTSAISSAAGRRTSRASHTRAPNRALRCIARRRSAATPPTPGGCTTCTATPSSGAANGITRGCRAARRWDHIGFRVVAVRR